MPQFTFPHNGPVYMIYDDHFEIAYYAREGKKYRRVRNIERQPWRETAEREVDNETFWMVIRMVELRGRYA